MTNQPINIKLKLALLWTTLMFLYIYADYFELMTPGKLQRMMDLQTPVGPTKPGILIIFSGIMIIPSLMIVAPVFLRPSFCRWINIIVGSVYFIISILMVLSGLDNAWQAFFALYNVADFFLLGAIVWQAWMWPRETVTGL